jgi:hypothetical protein
VFLHQRTPGRPGRQLSVRRPICLALTLCFAALALACVQQNKWVKPVPEKDRPPALYLAFAGAKSTGFTAPDGRPCKSFASQPAGNGILGWDSQDKSETACSHDTLHEGVGKAVLELRWAGQLPKDGNYEVNTFGYTMRTLGEVACRGGVNAADTFAVATLVVEVRSAHCALTWSTPVASAFAYGPWTRTMPFYGYQEIPPLQVDDCKGGDTLDVRARLEAAANRGRVDVDAFGFTTGSYSDALKLVGLVEKSQRLPDERKLAKCTRWASELCAVPWERHY